MPETPTTPPHRRPHAQSLAPPYLALDQGRPHDVEALDDSAFLLTIAWPRVT